MMYNSILARSFTKHQRKQLRYGAFAASFLFTLSLCTVFRPYLLPHQTFNSRLSVDMPVEKMLLIHHKTTSLDLDGHIIQIVNSDAEFLSVDQTNVSPEIADNKMGSVNETSIAVVDEKKGPINETSIANTNMVTANETFLRKIEGDNITLVSEVKIPRKINVEPICDYSEPRTDTCEINGDIRIHGKSSTIFVSLFQTGNNSFSTIRPYARKMDKTAMNNAREWTIRKATSTQQCAKNHNVPAILFSTGGYSGNHFHAFTDVIIPLFLTSRQFNGEVQFLISDSHDYWTTKFKGVLKGLSRYDFIDIDKDDEIHCFSSIIVGLRSHKEMGIDSLRSLYSMKDFRHFLRATYMLKKSTAIKMEGRNKRKPRLVMISRKRTRGFSNVGEIAKMSRRLGYKVIVSEPDANMTRVAELVNSCDILMGVHGAGLTNMVFLPENAILIQVVPIGGFDWLANTFFGEPASDMNIRYLDYKIAEKESSLIRQYGENDDVLRNPNVILKKGWDAWKSIYLEQQNVELDVHRFRPILLKALELLHS